MKLKVDLLWMYLYLQVTYKHYIHKQTHITFPPAYTNMPLSCFTIPEPLYSPLSQSVTSFSVLSQKCSFPCSASTLIGVSNTLFLC